MFNYELTRCPVKTWREIQIANPGGIRGNTLPNGQGGCSVETGRLSASCDRRIQSVPIATTIGLLGRFRCLKHPTDSQPTLRPGPSALPMGVPQRRLDLLVPEGSLDIRDVRSGLDLNRPGYPGGSVT